MDPSETELNAMSTLADVGNWAGTTGPLEESLLALLGRPTKLRDVAFIARTTWDRVVSGLTMVTAATDTAPAITRPLNPTEESRIEIFRREWAPVSVVPAGPGMAPGGGRGAGSPMSTTPTRKLKLSSVVDPTLDAEIIHMEATELEQVYNDYRTKFGALPSQDVDPTNDQLSGLRQLIMSKALPYVDLSIWGPFGLRTLRKQVFTSYIFNASTGNGQRRRRQAHRMLLPGRSHSVPTGWRCFSSRPSTQKGSTPTSITSRSCATGLAQNAGASSIVQT